MIHPPIVTDKCPAQATRNQRMRFGTRELLTAMLLSSVAFATQPAVGWKAAVCMTGAALALVMGWGFVALVGSLAALSLACYQADTLVAVSVCVGALMTIALGPLAADKLSRFFTASNRGTHDTFG